MSKNDVVTVGPTHSAKAYIDRETGKPTSSPPPVIFGNHRFFETDDHQLGHEIDGKLVATVPPEGMKDYAALWPDCRDLVSQLTGKPRTPGDRTEEILEARRAKPAKSKPKKKKPVKHGA